jgi:hypothetical protein
VTIPIRTHGHQALFGLMIRASKGTAPRGAKGAPALAGSGHRKQIDFSAPALLKKWPSIGNERAKASRWPNPYLVLDGTLDECIQAFVAKPASQRHLYEIHTAPQTQVITAVLSAEQIIEIARLRDFL